MGCEKRNVKREMSKEREKMAKEGDTRHPTHHHLHTTLTASQLPMPLSPQTTTSTTSQLCFNVSAHIFTCRTRAKCCSEHLPWQAELIVDKGQHILTMSRTFSFSQYGAHEDDGAECMWAHGA
jgi:hypothetical protein